MTTVTTIGMLVQTADGADRAPSGQTRSAVARTVEKAAVAQHARVIGDRIGDGSASRRPPLDVAVVGSGDNQLERDTTLGCATVRASEGLDGILAERSGSGSDTIGGLNAMADHLNGSRARTTEIVLVGNLVSNRGPFRVDDWSLADPAAAVDRLEASGQLPDCKGWQVYAVGGGLGRQLDDEQRLSLREFYRLLFGRCGGTLRTWDTALSPFPNRSARVHPLSKKVTKKSTAKGVKVTLPATVFDTGNATLRPDAVRALRVGLGVISSHPGSRVDVTGYTDSTPTLSRGGNRRLSLDRARNVGAWLRDHGVTELRLHVHGAGATGFVAANTTVAGRQANRRVEIIVSS